jgi:hypothetical protein
MRYDFPKHRSGDTWAGIGSITILENGLPLNLTGSKIYIDFRSAYNSASPSVLTLTTDNNTITIVNAVSGIISIPRQILSVPTGLYNYDLEVDFQNGDSKTYLEGQFEVTPGVTKSLSETAPINNRYTYLLLESLMSVVCANSATNWSYQGNDLKAFSPYWQDATTTIQKNSAYWFADTLIRSLTSSWDSTFNTVNSLSSEWIYSGSDVKELSSFWQFTHDYVESNSPEWQSAYSTVLSNSSYWINNGITLQTLSSNWQQVYNIVNDNNLKWFSVFSTVSSLSSHWNYDLTNIESLSSYWQSVYNTVASNSAVNWNYQGNDLKALTAEFHDIVTLTQSNSSNWNYQGNDLKALTGEFHDIVTLTQNNSSNWNYQGDDLKALTAEFHDVANLTQSNSAVWNYQGYDLKSLSANWESTFSTVSSNSAIWVDAYTAFNSNSSNYSTYNYVSNFLPLSGGNINGTFSIKNVLSANPGSGDAAFATLSFNRVPGQDIEDVFLTDSTGTEYRINFDYDHISSQIINIFVPNETIDSLPQAVTNAINNSGLFLASCDPITKIVTIRQIVNGSTGIRTNRTTGSAVNISNFTIIQNSLNLNSDLITNKTIYSSGSDSTKWDSAYTKIRDLSANVDTSLVQQFFDDFITLGASSTLPGSLLKQCNSGGTIIVSAEDTKQGVLVVKTNNLMIANQRGGATSGATIHFGQGTDYRLIFCAKRGDNSFTDFVNGRLDMGFHDMIATNSLYPDDGCYFSSENGRDWIVNTKTAASPLIQTNTNVPCDSTWRVFEIHVNQNASEVKFYIDNSLVATHTQSIPKDTGCQTAIGYRSYRYNNQPQNIELRLDWQYLITKRQNKLWI